VTLTPSDRRSSARPLIIAAIVIAAMTALRIIYASLIDLRTDEAYYWTWSKEHALSTPISACALVASSRCWSCNCCWPTSPAA
jgi:hypothetical protein